MKVTIEKGNTLLIYNGNFKLLEGSVTVFGNPLTIREAVTVGPGSALPVHALSPSILAIELNNGGMVTEKKGDSIPLSWKDTVKEITAETVFKRDFLKVMIIGPVDAGKTGFVYYLASQLKKKGKKVAVIDMDSGQSSIGPPTTIGYGFLSDSDLSLSTVRPESLFFIGCTTPKDVFHRVMAGLTRFLNELEQLPQPPDAVVVDTTGWVAGTPARDLKTGKIQILDPDFLVAISKEDTEHLVLPFAKKGGSIKCRFVEKAKFAHVRSREVRRSRRNSTFRKIFASSKEVMVELSNYNLFNTVLGTGERLEDDQAEMIKKWLNFPVISIERTPDYLVLITDENIVLTDKKELEQKIFGYGSQRQLKIIALKDIGNLLVAFTDNQDSFLGLGIIRGYSPKLRSVELVLSSTVELAKVANIHFGHLKVSPEGTEIGLLSPWTT
ncbi:MAG: Clp1/GlmU family protein [Candidatus Odinarchaeota archaeon]